MFGPDQDGGGFAALMPILIIGLVLLRNARERKVRMERLWIGPLMILIMTGFTLLAAPPTSLNAIVMVVVALGLGATLGWWRGRASTFTVDPETHVVTSRVSPVGMLLILGIFLLRYGLRQLLGDQAGALHVTALDVADAFLVLLVGVVCAQRLEWFLRARRLIAEAKAA